MSYNNLLERIITWLETRRVINIILALLYFLFIYFMHDPVVHLSIWVMNLLSLPVYNKVVTGIFALFIILFSALLFTQLKEHKDNRRLKITYLIIILFLIVAHFKVMLEMNIEVIHIFEFPVLALLLFPLTRRFGATVLFTLPFMLIDEWHQYVILYPAYVEQFEFNDVVMDINGCALAMLSLMICGVRGATISTSLWKRTEFILLCCLLMLAFIGVRTCFIAFYEAEKCNSTWLVLNKIKGEQFFWRQYPGRDVIYHVMQPLESLIVIPLLSLFYFGLDSWRNNSFTADYADSTD